MTINRPEPVTSKNVTAFVAGVSSFITPFMGSAVNIALPAVGNEFSMDAVLLAWVALAYSLTAAAFLVPFGRLADIYGRKKIFLWGFILYTVASFLCALAGSALTLILFRVLQGVGASMIFGTGWAILTSVFPASERGKALGINIGAVYSGLSLGPVLGGFLTQQFGWRSIFSINAALGALVIVLIIMRLKGEWAECKGEKFDLAGSILFGVSLISLMYGFSQMPTPTGIVLTSLGVAGMAGFIFWENRTKSPVLEVSLFRKNAVFVLSNLAALVNYSATFAVGFLLSLYLQYIKGLPPQGAGYILVAQPIVQALLSPIAGRLSDKVEPRILATIGMGITVAGLGLLTFLDADTPLPYIIGALMLLGLGFAFFSSPNTNAVMSSVEKRYYGVASATLGTMRLSGQMFSLGIVLILFAVYMGRVQITPEYYGSFIISARLAFIVFAILCFGGIFASLSRGKVRR